MKEIFDRRIICTRYDTSGHRYDRLQWRIYRCQNTDMICSGVDLYRFGSRLYRCEYRIWSARINIVIFHGLKKLEKYQFLIWEIAKNIVSSIILYKLVRHPSPPMKFLVNFQLQIAWSIIKSSYLFLNLILKKQTIWNTYKICHILFVWNNNFSWLKLQVHFYNI